LEYAIRKATHLLYISFGKMNRHISDIRERAAAVTSFVAEYRASLRQYHSPMEVAGQLSFLNPNMFRLDTITDNRQITTIRRGRLIERYLVKRKELWKYNLDNLPLTEPINFGVADLRDPFCLVDAAALNYEGTNRKDTVLTYAFSAPMKGLEEKGMLDTRKGFSIRYQPKPLVVRMNLYVDTITGLLRRMSGIDNLGNELFQANYAKIEVNVPMDSALFVMSETAADYKVINAAETLLPPLDPDVADSLPSVN
jgi:hypothetical protein